MLRFRTWTAALNRCTPRTIHDCVRYECPLRADAAGPCGDSDRMAEQATQTVAFGQINTVSCGDSDRMAEQATGSDIVYHRR